MCRGILGDANSSKMKMLVTCSLKELQALDTGQLEAAQIETRPVRFAEGDVVALKHNWKRYLEPSVFGSYSSGGASSQQ